MIYLNNASTSFPKPPEVLEKVKDFIVQPPINKDRSGVGDTNEDIAAKCRSNLKKIFHIKDDQSRIIFTSGSTEALNLALLGLPLNEKHIVASNAEHNSTIRPLNFLSETKNTEITKVNVNKHGNVDPDDIEKVMRDDTELVCVSHCSNVTGALQDIKKIAKIAHEHGALVLVDGSQSAGIMDIDLDDMGIDLFAFTGHKSLYGLRGIGGIYIRKGIDLEPLKHGGTGILSAEPFQPEKLPHRYEAGTPNMPGIASLNAGIEWVLSKGYEEIGRKKERYVEYLTDEYKYNDAVEVYNSPENSSKTIFSFNLRDYTPQEVNYVLASSFDIHIRSGLHCAPWIRKDLGCGEFGTLRVSPSYFTTDEEIERFTEALNMIINEGI